jgi:hypothetical protein
LFITNELTKGVLIDDDEVDEDLSGVIVVELESDFGEDEPSAQLSAALLFKLSKDGEVKTPLPLTSTDPLDSGG